MPNRHILIISQGFAPWGGPSAMRATKLASCGLGQGVRVSVLTNSVACAHVFDDPDLLDEVQGAEILRVSNGTDYPLRGALAGALGYYPTRAVDKLIAKTRAQWVDACYRAARARWDGDRPDVVYCTAPPHDVVLIAQRLAEAWDAPFVMDFRDPPWEIGMSGERFESALATCDLAVFNTPPAAERVRQEHARYADRVECWTNGVDHVRERLEISKTPNGRRKVRLVYPGGLYPDVVNAVKRLRSFIDQGHCDITVYGFQECKRNRQRDALRALRVTCESPMPDAQIARLLAASDAVLVVLPSRYEYRVPMKTYAAINSGRPMMAFGRSRATEQMTDGLTGIFRFDETSPEAEIGEILSGVANYDVAEGWPRRLAWLQDKTWPRIYEGIFGRYA